MTNEEIFQDFWKNYQWPDSQPVIYRLYHDDQGRALEYSMEQHDGVWVDITAAQYAIADMRVRVVNGALTLPPPPPPPKMIPSDTGIACHPWSVALIVDADQKHQKWKRDTYEN